MQEQINNSNLLETNYKELSIQIKLSGLSFCVFNPVLNCIETIYKLSWQKDTSQREIKTKINSFLNTEGGVRQDFSEIRVMHSNEYFTLVPDALFDKDIALEYLKYNAQIPPVQYITYDKIETLDLIVVYAPYKGINDLLLEHFGAFSYEHIASVLLRTILPHKASHTDSVVYTYIDEDNFYLVVFIDNQLVLFNQFQYFSVEDFLYYLLFSLKQLKIDTMEVPLFVMGNIARQMPIYDTVYRYFKKIYFFQSLHQPAFCQDMDDNLVREHFLLTHLFS